MMNQSIRKAARRFPIVGRPVAWLVRTGHLAVRVPRYVIDWSRYTSLYNYERPRLRDADPRLSDRLPASPYDPHYLNQAVWAAERIFANDPSSHVDVGSELTFVGVLAAKLPVTFVDLRPLDLKVGKLEPLEGDILSLPFEDRSIASLSCLHVAEHVGLGRYGDQLNPAGTRLALKELQRVVAPNGNLFLSLPIGRPRICFNAHRIHDPRDVIQLMDPMELVEFSAVDDDGRLHLNTAVDAMTQLDYGCGLFWLRSPETGRIVPAE